jgi:DNA-binding MarR family transcriptional regulator
MSKDYQYVVTITPRGVYQDQRLQQGGPSLIASDIEKTVTDYLARISSDGSAAVGELAKYVNKTHLDVVRILKVMDQKGLVKLRFMHDMYEGGFPG